MTAVKHAAGSPEPSRLDWFQVRGFKSHRDGSRIDLRALTVLAGANSSGKSSVMQPLLLLKQTLHEDRYDPGPLKLDGPNVVFTDTEQFFTHDTRAVPMKLALGLDEGIVALTYRRVGEGVQLVSTSARAPDGSDIELTEGTALPAEVVPASMRKSPFITNALSHLGVRWRGARRGIAHRIEFAVGADTAWASFGVLPAIDGVSDALMKMIHLGGHRGNPSRRYPRSVNSSDLRPGVFHEQAAGIIAHWKQRDPDLLKALLVAMRTVGLGWSIEPVDLDATAIDLRIGRTRETSRHARDLVSIADVGFGVSQSLPVLVALIDAKPGQLVYIEQPEIHLHPRAQIGVADLIVAASARGARVVIETHSEIILTRIQFHVASGTIPAQDVLVHWFACDAKTGDTTVTAVEPDASGAFGDWPVDFAEIGERVDREYVEAAWKRQAGDGG
jgi:hypothetical protein